MSDNSITQTDATAQADQPERWWFTFGSGQTHPLTGEDLSTAYVVLEGTYDETREVMLTSPFENRWSFQYSSATKAAVDRFRLRQIEMPEPADAYAARLVARTAKSKIWACPEADCGYHIADGPAADGEPTTDELIAEHLEEHAPDVAEALAFDDAVELVDELPEPESERAAFTRGLREAAEWLDAHPEVPLPYLGFGGLDDNIPTLDIYILDRSDGARAKMATIFRAMTSGGGRADKVVNDLGAKGRMNLVRQFGGIRVVASADRDVVCRRVVIDSREVEVEVPDPSVVASVPLVKVTKIVEEVRWECPPLLADDPAQVAAAVQS